MEKPIKYTDVNKFLKDLKKGKLKNKGVWLDERTKELCNCPTCEALRKIGAMAFYDKHMANVQNMFYRIMMNDKK